MKKVIVLIIIIYMIISKPFYCDFLEELMDEQLKIINVKEMQDIVDNINTANDNHLPKLNVKDIIKNSYNTNPFKSIKALLKGMWTFIMFEFIKNLELLGKIIILSVLCAIFQNLHTSFENDSIGKLAYSICYIVIIILAINSFSVVSIACIDTIDSIVVFMQSLLPILITLLLSVGGMTSFSLFQPVVYTSLAAIVTFIKTVIIPMIVFSSILSIISNISEKVRISRLASLLKEVAIALLGIILTVFTGIISIQGLAAASLDGVMAKATKFTVDNFIPVIGDFLSEAFDTVIGCTLLVKNGVSIVGLIVLLYITLAPVIKILAIFLSYKLGAALIQPIIDNELVQSLNDISNAIFLLLCCMSSVSVLFFISITIIMGIGNITIMMR